MGDRVYKNGDNCVCAHKRWYSCGRPCQRRTVCVYENERPRVGESERMEGGITKGMLVCMCTSSQPHWPDELCSLQKRDFSEMRGHKTGD